MGGFTEILVYATWGAAPILAYQALMMGMRRQVGSLAVIGGLYSVAVIITYLTVRTEVAANGFGATSPMAVLIPWVGAMILSGGLYLLGTKAAERDDR